MLAQPCAAALDAGLRSSHAVDRRLLDDDELALLGCLRDGASTALDTGEATLETEWLDVGDAGADWPVFLLRPASDAGLAIRWWMSPDANWRRDDLVVAGFTFGDFAEGICGHIGAPDRDSLAESVARCVRALVEGRATYEVSKADPENYDGPIAPDALELRVRWRFPGEHGGSGGAVVRTYLANPDAFTALTGIPIAAQLGEKHTLTVLGAPA